MSRLFYEKEKTVKFSGSENENDSNFQMYLEKVAKLIPGEVIAAYLTMMGLAAGIGDISKNIRNIVVWCIFIVCVIFTPIYLNYLADKNKPKIIHLLISTVAFVVWAYQVTGDKLPGIWYNANIASILLILYTLFSGIIILKK